MSARKEIDTHTKVEIHGVKINSLEQVIGKLDTTVTSLQGAITQLNQMYVTQKELDGAQKNADKEHADLWKAIDAIRLLRAGDETTIAKLKTDIWNLKIRMAFACGGLTVLVFFKDPIFRALHLT